jgi:hypothetical protein
MKHNADGQERELHKSMKPARKSSPMPRKIKDSTPVSSQPDFDDDINDSSPDTDASYDLDYDDGSSAGAYQETIVDDDDGSANMLDDMYAEQSADEVAPPEPMQQRVAPTVVPQPTRLSSPSPVLDANASSSEKGNVSSHENKKKRKRYDRKKTSSIKNGGAVLSQNHARLWRYGFLVIFVIILGFVVKAAFIPPKTLSISDVDNQIVSATGQTKFPMAQGSSIAEAFVSAYIPVNGSSVDQSILQNFYGGQKFTTVTNATGIDGGTPTTTGTVSQVIQSGPYVYSEEAMSDTTANFVIGALIYRIADGQPVKTSDGSSIDYKWIYLNVGVYWDESKNTFAIDRNSPTLTSAPSMKASASLSDSKLPGNGETDNDVKGASKEAITNFMKAWAASDTSALSTLTPSDKTNNTMNGLNGKYSIDTDSDGLKFDVYGLSAGDNLYRALVKVKWKDTVKTGDNDTSVSYPSQYILKLEKSSDGKYLIQDINPYYYVQDTSK